MDIFHRIANNVTSLLQDKNEEVFTGAISKFYNNDCPYCNFPQNQGLYQELNQLYVEAKIELRKKSRVFYKVADSINYYNISSIVTARKTIRNQYRPCSHCILKYNPHNSLSIERKSFAN